MSWIIILWSLIGSCIMLIVNVLVIEHIYSKKEARWDAFCEEAAQTREDLRKLQREFSRYF